MLNHIKGGLKVFYDYCISLILFIIFLYPFLSFTKENFLKWLPLFSLFIFLLMALITYSDMKALAFKEKRPQYSETMMPYPWKGIVLGLIGFVPFIIIEIVLFSFTFGEVLEVLKPALIKGLLGPIYFFISIADNGALGYIIANLAIPVISLLGYLAGHYDYDLGVKFKKYFKKLKEIKEKIQEKYPSE